MLGRRGEAGDCWGEGEEIDTKWTGERGKMLKRGGNRKEWSLRIG